MRVVGHHHGQAGVEDAIDANTGEARRYLPLEAGGEDGSLGLHMLPKGFKSVPFLDEDEVPWLGQADAGGGVRGARHTLQDGRFDALAGELPAHVSPAPYDVVEGVAGRQLLTTFRHSRSRHHTMLHRTPQGSVLRGDDPPPIRTVRPSKIRVTPEHGPAGGACS